MRMVVSGSLVSQFRVLSVSLFEASTFASGSAAARPAAIAEVITCEKRIFAEDDWGKRYRTCEKKKKKTSKKGSYHAQATSPSSLHEGPPGIIYSAYLSTSAASSPPWT